MSTENGMAKVVADAMRDARAIVDRAQAEEDQLNLLDPLDPEEILEARQRLGGNASHLAVVKEARTARSGRPRGARNKRTDDMAAYLRQFGPDPAIAAMRIIGTTEELMIQRSIEAGDGKRRMTLGEAQQHRMRMIELMMPYFHGKKPVQVDMTFSGVADLVIEGLTHSTEEVRDIVDADFLPVDPAQDNDGEVAA